MAYIKFKIDNKEYDVQLGECIAYVNSAGRLDLGRGVTITKYGNTIGSKLPLETQIDSMSVVGSTGNQYVVNIQNDIIYRLESAYIRTMRNTSRMYNDPDIYPFETKKMTQQRFTLGNFRLFNNIPDVYTLNYDHGLYFTSIPIKGEVFPATYVVNQKNGMFFKCTNLGEYPIKTLLFFAQPWNYVCANVATNIEMVDKTAELGLYPDWTQYTWYTKRTFWNTLPNTYIEPPRINGIPTFQNGNIIWAGNNWTGSAISGSMVEDDIGKDIYYMQERVVMVSGTTDWYSIYVYSEDNIDDEPEPPPTPPTPPFPDDDSDDIPIPNPSIKANALITIYNLTLEQLDKLAQEIWTQNFLENILNLTPNPLDSIIFFNAYNFTIPLKGEKTIKIGGSELNMASAVVEDVVIQKQLGRVYVPPYFATYADFTQTQCIIHLPYIGTKEIPTELVMNSNLELVYNIDIVSGDCVALVKVKKIDSKLNSVVLSFKGNCRYSFPLGGANYSRMGMDIFNSILKSGMQIQNVVGGVVNAQYNANTITNITDINGNAGVLDTNEAFIEFRRYMNVNPTYYMFNGGNTYQLVSIQSLTGYTECDISELSLECTNEEKEMLKLLCDKGVYF